MTPKIVAIGESRSTIGADVRLVRLVNVFVLLQVVLCGESVLTSFTLERAFA